MANITLTPGYTFTSGETVEANDLNLLGSPTVAISNIVNADIGSGAAIEASKLAATLDLSSKTVTLPATSVSATALASNAVTTAKINNAAVTAAKLDGAQTGSAPIYGCRAWVNFDGVNVTNVGGEDRCTIRANGNVSKVVRASAGVYTVHFTTAMPDANYAVVMSGSQGLTQNDNFVSARNYAASTVEVVGHNATGGGTGWPEDMIVMSVAIFR